MSNTLYDTDYVIVDSKTKKPMEGYETIYHYTSVINHLNEILIDEGKEWEYVSMSELSDEDKKKYKETIKEMESIHD